MSTFGTEAVVDDLRRTHSTIGQTTAGRSSETRQDVPRPSVPTIEVRGGRGRFSLETLRELWIYREVLTAFAVRAVKVKYKQAAIGIGWAVVQPVLTAGLFAITIGRLSHISSEGSPYLLFALAGMVAWTYFSMAGNSSMQSLVEDSALLRKVYFPRDVLPLAAVLAGLVDLIPGILVLAVAAAAYGHVPGVVWLALPLPILVLAVTVAALGLALSSLNVYYRDVRYVLPFVMQLGMFACPIIYSLQAIPMPAQAIYAVGNPVAASIDALRHIVLHNQWPNMAYTLGALGFSVVLLIAAYMLFKRLERGFADRI